MDTVYEPRFLRTCEKLEEAYNVDLPHALKHTTEHKATISMS